MRKIKLSAAVSLDSYLARADGGCDWILHDRDRGLADFFKSDFFKSVDVVLIGRKTHDLMRASGMPAYAGMKNFVFSGTRRGVGEGGVEFVSGDLKKFTEALRAQPGKDIWLSGGGELISAFLREKLVDEISLSVQPVLLGSGIPLFRGERPETKLRLLSCREYAPGGVSLNYAVER